MSGSGRTSDVLSEGFLERFEIRSEADVSLAADSDSGEEELFDSQLFDRRFNEDPRFRDWVSRKTAAPVVRPDRERSGPSVEISSRRDLRGMNAASVRSGHSDIRRSIYRPLLPKSQLDGDDRARLTGTKERRRTTSCAL